MARVQRMGYVDPKMRSQAPAASHDFSLFLDVDGTLVEKAVGFEESRLAGELMYLVKAYLRQNDRGIAVGEAGMMRIAPGLGAATVIETGSSLCCRCTDEVCLTTPWRIGVVISSALCKAFSKPAC